MTAPQTLKGFRDFLPSDMHERIWLRAQIVKTFELWGFEPLETPTLEPLELFEGQIGEDEKLFFKFEDAGGRKVAMRYDQSVPAARVVGQFSQELPMPFKRYQIQPAYRAEKPQKGRYREFLQCDADIFGSDSALADAEVIALSLDIYRRLGFQKAKVSVNDRALFAGMPYDAVSAIDKLKKIGEAGVLKDMATKGITKEKGKKYLDSISKAKPNDTINIIFDYLAKNGFDDSWYEFDPTIARSFSYSTGPIWEVTIPGVEGGSVLGGERFDKLVEKVSGKSVPATGFGLGFDRTLEAAKELKLIPKSMPNAKVLVSVLSAKELPSCLSVVELLRRASINCELYTDPTAKLAKQLKYADQKGIPYTIVLGPAEIAKDVVLLKDMASKSQKEVTKEALLTILSK